MEDYISVLLEHLSENRRLSAMSGEYLRCLTQEEAAFEALRQALTEEQRKLFRAYEDARNATASVSEDDFARTAFLLAKEIYR